MSILARDEATTLGDFAVLGTGISFPKKS